MSPKLAAAEPLDQLGNLWLSHGGGGGRWQHGQVLGPSSSGRSTLLYPLSATKISYQYIAGNVGKLGLNT